MSLALLLEKYDVSTEEGLQKAINEIEKEELEVDEALSGVLSRASCLEGHLRTASQAYSKLGAVKADAQAAADMVEKTATLARDVSAKVRQLDLARSRVAECQRRVHDLIDLQVCSAGVEAAIKANDYETGAMHVARFLSMEPGSVAASPEPCRAITAAAAALREHLVKKLEEAARKEDDANVERLFKLFPQIGHADEGVRLFAKYLATQLESQIRRITVSESRSEAAVFADAFTRLLEAGAAAADRVRSAAPGQLPRALTVMQPSISAGARRLWSELCAARGLLASTSAGRRVASAPQPPPPPPPPPDARTAELVAAELALVCSRIKLYFSFLRRKTEADAITLDAAGRAKAMEAVEKIINECDLMMTAQDVLAQYLAMERIYVEESVNKALKLAAPQPGVTTSSLVDDVFFIARKVIRRSISTGIIDGACAVLNEVSSLVERQVAPFLRRALRSPPADPLGAGGGGGGIAVAGVGGLLGQRLNRDVEAQRLLFLAHMTEAELGAEWSERLAAEAVTQCEPLFRDHPASSREKVVSCAGGLAAAAAACRAAYDLGLAGVKAALRAKVNAWAETIVKPEFDIEEMEDDADAVPAALDALAEQARAELSAATASHLLLSVVGDIATAAEARILHHTYQRESGLLVERRARRLASWAGGAGAGGRERCARLVAAAGLLALDRPGDAVGAGAAAGGARAKEILARRSDFKMEDIKRLKL